MIELHGVRYSYSAAPALAGIDLSVKRGESMAIIGPNASGKSTLLKIICGLLYASEGSYVFDGQAITKQSLADSQVAKPFHQRVGLLFQDPSVQLFCGSVYDEIAFGPEQMGMAEELVEERVESLLRLFKLEHLKTRVPYHLSGGEKSKVALASVLALNPDVLCLDEPMGGLDPKTKHSLREHILSLNAAGKTILCATHDFEYVDGIFRRAAVLSEQGTIARVGAYDDVLADRAFLESMNIV